jgi:ADP-ribosyl-[dinitrogen reductase] hydrolase
VHTLEAALWCLMTGNSYQNTVLKAVNLGEDTDTTAAVAGGLAGIAYGLDSIPHDWVAGLARLEDIRDLAKHLHSAAAD